MKKLILPLLLFISCATYSPEKLSIEKAEQNANFVLNILKIESDSLICSKGNSEIICKVTNKNKETILYCNNDECLIEN